MILNMRILNKKSNTTGYLFNAIGKKYVDLSINLLQTLRIFKDDHPASIVILEEDYDFVDELNYFDEIIIFNTSDLLLRDCETQFEKFGVVPKLRLLNNTPYKECIFLDSDILCIGNTKNMWKFFRSKKQDFNLTGLKYDPDWHVGRCGEISNFLKINVPHAHSGIIYMNNIHTSKLLHKVFQDAIKVFYSYENLNCYPPKFRGGKADEIMFAIAMAWNNLEPLDNYEYPVITFNLPSDCNLPTKTQTCKMKQVECKKYLAFDHHFEKLDREYFILFNRILNSTTP